MVSDKHDDVVLAGIKKDIERLDTLTEKFQVTASKRHSEIQGKIAALELSVRQQFENKAKNSWLAPTILITIAITCVSAGLYWGREQNRTNLLSIEIEIARLMEQIIAHGNLDAHQGAVPRRELDQRLGNLETSLEHIESMLMQVDIRPLR